MYNVFSVSFVVMRNFIHLYRNAQFTKSAMQRSSSNLNTTLRLRYTFPFFVILTSLHEKYL